MCSLFARGERLDFGGVSTAASGSRSAASIISWTKTSVWRTFSPSRCIRWQNSICSRSSPSGSSARAWPWVILPGESPLAPARAVPGAESGWRWSSGRASAGRPTPPACSRIGRGIFGTRRPFPAGSGLCVAGFRRWPARPSGGRRPRPH